MKKKQKKQLALLEKQQQQLAEMDVEKQRRLSGELIHLWRGHSPWMRSLTLGDVNHLVSLRFGHTESYDRLRRVATSERK